METKTLTKTYPTKNDLAEALRSDMIELLNQNLALGIHLSLQTKQAHWNVKGPSFFQLHELFDQVYAESVTWVDDMAERAVQLGGIAEGTLEKVQSRSKLPVPSTDIASGPEHVEALSKSLAAFGKSVRAAIDAADNAGDADTADLFTGISRGADKQLWFVEAHLHADK